MPRHTLHPRGPRRPARPLPAVPASTSSALALLLRPADGPVITAATEADAAADAAAKVAAEVVEAELVGDVADLPSFNEVSVDHILDSFLNTRGWLVPARLAELTDPGESATEAEHRLNRAKLLDELRASAWADGTLANYGGHVRAWRAWCSDEGISALPFRPDAVANFLLDYAFVFNEQTEDFERDADGGLLPAVTAGSVGNRVAALNLAAGFIGLPRPGDNPGIQELLRGIRRRLGTAPEHRKAALDLDRLNACLAAATGARYTAARTRAAVLARARTGATAGQLASLVWADVTLDAERVTLELAPAHRYGKACSIVIPAHPNADLCLAHALRQLRKMDVRLGRVFARPPVTTPRRPSAGTPQRSAGRASGGPMTRQALHHAVDAAATSVGGWEALPGLPDRELARLLDAECPATPLAVARDQALLLSGFWTAGRRSNLSALNWRDITDHGVDGIGVRFRRSKTDQEGHGRTKWLPKAPPGSDKACPATAMCAWREQLTAALGRAPREDEPVFVQLTGAGTLKVHATGRPARLTGEGINDVVQRLVVAAGLTGKPKRGERNPYGAHSLRAGFVTEAFRTDRLSILDVQEVTDHKTVDVLVTYRREVQAPTNNAARRMFG